MQGILCAGHESRGLGAGRPLLQFRHRTRFTNRDGTGGTGETDNVELVVRQDSSGRLGAAVSQLRQRPG